MIIIVVKKNNDDHQIIFFDYLTYFQFIISTETHFIIFLPYFSYEFLFRFFSVFFFSKFNSHDASRNGEVEISKIISAAGISDKQFGGLFLSFFDDKNRGSKYLIYFCIDFCLLIFCYLFFAIFTTIYYHNNYPFFNFSNPKFSFLSFFFINVIFFTFFCSCQFRRVSYKLLVCAHTLRYKIWTIFI